MMDSIYINNGSFYECRGFDVKGSLDKIERSKDYMSPVFEALSNSLDSIVDPSNGQQTNFIEISFDFTSVSPEGMTRRLDSITIRDSGIGFTDENYGRFLSLNDRSKGSLNKGSGRVQFIKFFSSARFESYYKNSDDQTFCSKRVFELSAEKIFLQKNALVREYENDALTQERETGTVLCLRLPIDSAWARPIEEGTAGFIKEKIISRFLLRLNEERYRLPKILIVFRVNQQEVERAKIELSDIPGPRRRLSFEVPYKYLSSGVPRRKFTTTDKSASFRIEAFTIFDDLVSNNIETFVSRGEGIEGAKLGLANNDEKIGDFHYVIAISGDYIDEHVAESRDGLAIKKDKEFVCTPLLEEKFPEVSIDDIRKYARKECAKLLPELEAKKQEQIKTLDRIRTSFGFAQKTINAIRNALPLNASKEDILKKLYRHEAGITAKGDDSIDSLLLALQDMNPNSEQYQEELRERADQLFELIPEQNKLALPHYFSRRKIVLDLLGMALERKLKAQTEKQRIEEESLLHNILFRRHSKNPLESDLWILNEEFVYFSGTSDVAFKNVECDGKKLLLPIEKCPQKYIDYLNSGGDKTKKRPDILLFPQEGKCVLIELKRPGIDLSDYIPQIQKYAYLIYNYSSPDFKINRFYAYLIGGEVIPEDIRAVDSTFQLAKESDYMFTVRNVASKDNDGKDGEMYTEIHSYRTFFERAKMRNKTFLDLLLEGTSAQT